METQSTMLIGRVSARCMELHWAGQMSELALGITEHAIRLIIRYSSDFKRLYLEGHMH